MRSTPSAHRQRWIMLGLCFVATAINYIDRTNLSIAAPQIQRQFGLSPGAMGWILSGFFWSYAVMQMPMGWLIDRLGPKRVYGFAVGWWSAFTMATAFSRGMASLLGCRLMLGLGEAGGYPSNAKVTALWFAPRERGIATALFDSGSRVGAAISFPIVSFLVAAYGWKAAFLLTGGLGLVWLIGWLAVYHDPTPEEAETIGTMAAGDSKAAADPEGEIRWLDLFRYRTVWGMMAGFFCLNFVIYFFITWFPTYLVHERGFSLPKVGWLGSLPALCGVLGGWAGGFASDALFRRGWSLTAARKTCLVGGMTLSSCIALAAFARSNTEAIGLLCVSYASLSFSGASVWCLPADVAPSARYVATLGGIQNFASSLAGALTATFTGLLLGWTNGSFVLPLVAGGSVSLLGALSYLVVMGPVEPLRVANPSP